jgi:NTE family protein
MVPLTSLIRGKKLQAILEEAVEDLAGPGTQIEDTWKHFYCIASNYSKAYEAVLRHGNLAQGDPRELRGAGLLPPVPIGGDLMVDGGAFNNYPTDVMVRAGRHAHHRREHRSQRERVGRVRRDSGGWALAWDKLTGRRRKYRVPSLMSILMNATRSRARRARSGPSRSPTWSSGSTCRAWESSTGTRSSTR